MNRSIDSFNRAGDFFGSAFNKLERASEQQERTQGTGMADARYESDYDTSYLGGAVPPQKGPFGEDDGPVDNIESLKTELLETAREQKRPSNGSVVIRAGGGTNPAVRS